MKDDMRTSLLLAELRVAEPRRLCGRRHWLMRLPGGTVDRLDPQRALRLILRGKHHLVALANHVEEVPATLHSCK